MTYEMKHSWNRLGLLVVTYSYNDILIAAAQKDRTLQYYEYQCPKHFKNVGRKCYHFSNTTATWFQAFFSCKDFSASNLTVFTERYDQKQLEHYLFRNKIKNSGKYIDWKNTLRYFYHSVENRIV